MDSFDSTILFLCDYKSNYSGNFIASLLAIETHLKKKNARCVYVLPTECQERPWTQELLRLGKRVEYYDFGGNRIQKIAELNRLIDRYHATVVHAHFCYVVGLEALSVFKRKTRFIIHVHSDFSGGKSSLKQALLRRIIYGWLPSKCKFVFVSPSFLKYNRKMIHLPNALATIRLPCAHKSGDFLRRELGIDHDTILVELFGWSPYIKGVDIAYNAVGKLAKEGYPIKLMIICGRKVTKTEMIEYVRSNTQYSGDEDFACYVEPIEDVFCYHEAADICLSASRSETFSYALLEALSLGKRCVSSNIPGVQWSFRYESTVPFANESVDDCCEAIQKAIRELPSASTDTANRVKAEYNIDAWAQRIIEIYGMEE